MGTVGRSVEQEPSRDAIGFRVFSSLYSIALLVEIAEGWEQPIWTLVLVAAVGAMVARGPTVLTFTILVATATGYFLAVEFPDVANHVNFLLIVNVFLLAAAARVWVRVERAERGAAFQRSVGPGLRVSLAAVYMVAGFHKLNHDYFDADVTCAASIFSRTFDLARTRLFGVPAILVLAVVAVVVVRSLAAHVHPSFWPAARRAVPYVAAAVSLGAVVFVVATIATDTAPDDGVRLALALSVVGWELGGGALLLSRRAQAPVLAVSLVMHATLALVSFVDFGALALALLFSFVPPAQVGLLRPGRVLTYASLNIAAVVLWGIELRVRHLTDMTTLAGILFVVGVLVLVWPLLVDLVRGDERRPWVGVEPLGTEGSRAVLVLPLLVVLVASTSYVGLRTAGNFSMFSNLVTEGERSNHLLLGDNPLKIWDYQEDVVRIVAVDDEWGDAIHRWDGSMEGKRLPVVELRKWVREWEEAGDEVPITFEYRGERFELDDITDDPVWGARSLDAELYLLDFRPIQDGSPKRCTW